MARKTFARGLISKLFRWSSSGPEVRGLTSYQLLQRVRDLHGLDLIGFNLVEVSPPFDHGDITSTPASNIVFEYLSLLAIKNR